MTPSARSRTACPSLPIAACAFAVLALVPAVAAPAVARAAPEPLVKLVRQVNVAPDGSDIPGDAANEPSLAVDPAHPNRMAIGWRQFDTVTSTWREAGYAYSRDGGRTWTFPGSVDPGVFRSDPVLDCDADGTFYYLGLTMTRPPDPITRTCHLFRSTDGGATWSDAVFAWGGDKEWMAVDRSTGPGRGHIYSSWNPVFSDWGGPFFTRSVDGGLSFEAPLTMPGVPLFGTMVVDDDGALLIAGKTAGATGDGYVFLRSDDAQDAGTTPTFTAVPFLMGGIIVSGGAYVSPPNPDGYMGQVWLDVDRSGGPRHGWIYALASVDPPDPFVVPDDPMDLHFVRSTDGGVTWSAPVRVNDDPRGNGAWQWFGTMSVAPNGRIDVVWNDTRNTLVSTYSQLFCTWSDDGGATWAPNRAISGIWGSYLGFPGQSKIGDYYDTVSDDVGVHVAWAATFTGGQDIYYTRIGDYDCNANAVGDSLDIALGTSRDGNGNGIPDECEEGVSAVAVGPPAAGLPELRCSPNPFNPRVTADFALPRAGRATVAVHDAAGRRVAVLLDEERPAGAGQVAWDATGQASGVYFVRLVVGGSAQVAKVVLLR